MHCTWYLSILCNAKGEMPTQIQYSTFRGTDLNVVCVYRESQGVMRRADILRGVNLYKCIKGLSNSYCIFQNINYLYFDCKFVCFTQPLVLHQQKPFVSMVPLTN